MPVSRELGLPLKINRELGFGSWKLSGIWVWSVLTGIVKNEIGIGKNGLIGIWDLS